MFGKKKANAESVLTDRVRAIADRPRASAAGVKASRAPRQTLFRNATITLASGAHHAVVIKDISEGGARIEFLRDVPFDHEFTLTEATLKLRRRARLSWRKNGIAGLVFVD